MSLYLDERFSALEPYTPGAQPQKTGYVKLNTNESPFPPSPMVAPAVAAEAERLNRYPDPQAADLLEAFAGWFGLKAENCFVGNGSDEILAFCFQALCPNGAAFADLTYGFYPVYCQLYGVDAKIIPLENDFSLNVETYAGLGRSIFIANPNAPTGLALSREEITKVLRSNPGSLVVVDEAYVDFGAESALPLLKEYDNLLIVGTFSKSRSLAGARLGYALGSRELISDLNRIKYSFNPYNLNRMTMAAGYAALKDESYFEDCRRQIMAVRADATAALGELGFECTDSKANFIFVCRPKLGGEQLYTRLWKKNVLVRWWNKPRIKNHLRITVGSRAEMDQLLSALREILSN